MTENKNPIKHEWKEHYIFLEQLRESGITNMFGSPAYLRDAFDVGRRTSMKIVASWMENYEELKRTLLASTTEGEELFAPTTEGEELFDKLYGVDA